MSVQRSHLAYWGIGIAAFAALATLAFLKAWPLLNPQIVATASVDPACDLRAAPCSSRLPTGGTVTLSVEPRSIPVMEPVWLEVRVEGARASGVEVDIAGVDMNMGYNRPTLQPQADGRFLGQTTIPVCVRSRMDWEAKVLIRTPDGIIAAPYRFSTYRARGEKN
jgi:hypothetical protein